MPPKRAAAISREKQAIASLKSQLRIESRLIHRKLEEITPPDENLTLRGMRWTRYSAILKEETGSQGITAAGACSAFLSGVDATSSIYVHRVRLMILDAPPDLVGSSLLQASAPNSPVDSTAGTTRFTARGVNGASTSVIEWETGRLWKETPLTAASTAASGANIAVVHLARVGANYAKQVIIDVLADVQVNLSTWTCV
jgi:hypothetical protein